jgi:hypothetical protein
MFLVLGLVMLVALRTSAQSAKIDVTGDWLFQVQTDAGGGEPTVTFKQDGEKLTGHYSSATLGEADLTGTVKGTAIDFAFEGNVQGMPVHVTYKGTIDGASMKGSMSIAGAINGTFTGKRK